MCEWRKRGGGGVVADAQRIAQLLLGGETDRSKERTVQADNVERMPRALHSEIISRQVIF